MSQKTQKTRKQRDQFLAFALASADLLLEVDENGKILFALGAPRLLTGIDEGRLQGEDWLSLFTEFDQQEIVRLKEKSIPGKRCGPLLVELNDQNGKRKGVFTGLKMPDTDSFYVTLGLSNKMMSKLAAPPPNPKTTPSDKHDFKVEAEKAFDFARSIGEDPDITIFDFGATDTIKEEIGDEKWGDFQEELTAFMQSHATANANPCEFDDSHYGLIHDDEEDIACIVTGIEDIIEKYVPEGTDYKVKTQTVATDLNALSEWEAEKALGYLVTNYDASADDNTPVITTLKDSAKTFADSDSNKAKELKDMIDRVDFSLQFRPVAQLEDSDILHYQILPKFKNGSTEEWLMIAEDANLYTEFDLAFCERVINHINFKSGGSRTPFTAQLFPANTENPKFAEKIIEQLGKAQNIGERLCFEIKNYPQVKNKPQLAAFTAALKEKNHKLTISGINPTPAVFKEISAHNPDYIKIGRKYISDAEHNLRTQSHIKAMVKAAGQLGIKIIAGDVKSQEQLEKLKTLGIHGASGSHIGEAQDTLSFQPPQK